MMNLIFNIIATVSVLFCDLVLCFIVIDCDNISPIFRMNSIVIFHLICGFTFYKMIMSNMILTKLVFSGIIILLDICYSTCITLYNKYEK